MNKNKNGQALLLVLLAMATLATMMLSVVSRSVSEVGVTTREEESLRAFSAAEAGVEEALITGSQQQIIEQGEIQVSDSLEVPAGTGSSVVSTFNAAVERYPENPRRFAYPFELTSGQSASVWLVTRSDDEILSCGAAECFSGDEVQLCWGNPGASQTPAALVNIIYEDSTGEYAMAQTGFDSVTSRRNSNKFERHDTSSCTIDGVAYSYGADVDFSDLGIGGADTPVLMRVSLLYNTTAPQTFGVSAGSNLPIQGRRVSSEGVSGDTTRRIDAYLLNPEMPFIYDAALYASTGDISK